MFHSGSVGTFNSRTINVLLSFHRLVNIRSAVPDFDSPVSIDLRSSVTLKLEAPFKKSGNVQLHHQIPISTLYPIRYTNLAVCLLF